MASTGVFVETWGKRLERKQVFGRGKDSLNVGAKTGSAWGGRLHIEVCPGDTMVVEKGNVGQRGSLVVRLRGMKKKKGKGGVQNFP